MSDIVTMWEEAEAEARLTEVLTGDFSHPFWTASNTKDTWVKRLKESIRKKRKLR